MGGVTKLAAQGGFYSAGPERGIKLRQVRRRAAAVVACGR